MSPKNIIVCADGTGNNGGYSPDSNVYKIYKYVENNISSEQEENGVSEQLAFYDNGVGTDKNKYLRALGGAVGFGFGRNVCDLYKFLARNYEENDRIYFFGFSRGASTVRACNGMISKCGLVKGAELRNRELDARVKEAFKIYKKHRSEPEKAKQYRESAESHGVVRVHFLGIWDTVVALGFPKRTDVTGLLTLFLKWVFGAIEEISDAIIPHSFYHYKLTDNVEYACQALSIDDARTAFWPYVWNEKNIDGARDRTEDSVEQVWFSGMHSNVGGGYERSGMAGVPLYWMMQRAESHGLIFESDALKNARDGAHVHGRMYNSREGFAMFYRYQPREIENLCDGKLLDKIKIHHSVIERINHRTLNYAPGYIPETFDQVDIGENEAVKSRKPGAHPEWNKTRQLIDNIVLKRKIMYEILLILVFTVLFSAVYFSLETPLEFSADNLLNILAGKLDYILPDYFDGLINVAVVQKPYLFVGAVAVFLIYFFKRWSLNKEYIDTCETLRHYIIHEKDEA